MRILKYAVEVDAHEDGFWVTDVEMPVGSEPISCGSREFGMGRMGEVLIWALVPEESPTGIRKFGILGTGLSRIGKDELSEGTFLGTVINGPAVWHVFDLGEGKGV